MNEEMIKGLLQMMAEQMKTALKQSGIGEEFNPEGKKVVTLMPEVMLNVYIPVAVYSDENHYYFVSEDNILVYMGNIDHEGLEETIKKDVTTLSVFTNFVIANMLEDQDTLLAIMSDTTNMIALLQQMQLGEQYARDNGHIA